MTASRSILIVGGLALVIGAMCYGFWYAVFDEHQTLEHIGYSLANGFAQAAEGKLPAAQQAIEEYRAASAEYVREVHAHSHWGTLAMLLIVLGFAFDQVGFKERIKYWLAVLMVFGSASFPLGVVLQTTSLSAVGAVLTYAGSAAIIAGLAAITWGLFRPQRHS